MSRILIRQSFNTYIRTWKDLVYVENQVNHVSRSYEGWKGAFVRSLKRHPQELTPLLGNTLFPSDEVVIFVEELKRLWFVVTGENEDDLNDGEHLFSYADIKKVEQFFSGDYQPTQIDSPNNPWLKSIQIEITSLCNERCLHCYIPNAIKTHGNMMPTGEVMRIIDQFAEMQGLRIIFSGGEPFLHRDFFKILQYCRDKDLMIFIQSNISTITDEDIVFLHELNVFNIQVSLYSVDEHVHDMITKVSGSWKRTKTNLEKLVTNNIPAMISCPMMKQNYQGYADLYNYAQTLGVFCYIDYILLAQHDFGTDNLETRLSLEETSNLIDEVLNHDSGFKNIITSLSSSADLDIIPFAQRFLKCEILRNSICIAVNGNAYPCPAWQGMVVGDSFNQSLYAIWTFNKKVAELRRVQKEDFIKCRQCKLKNYCDMCPVYNYNENNGDMFHVCNRFCETAALLRKKVNQRLNYT